MLTNIDNYRRKVAAAFTRLQSARDICVTMEESLTQAEFHEGVVLEAQELAQKVAQAVQQQAHDRIAGVVSRCLEAVFVDNSYDFRIIFERKRGRTEAKLVFERDGMLVDPLTASGGGIVDMASFALRLSCLILHKPPLRRVLLMDEPFKYVSEEYRERVCLLLQQLSCEMNVQFIIVTHIDELKTGTVIEITR